MASSTFLSLPEFLPYQNRFLKRITEFTHFRRYYDGSVYQDKAYLKEQTLYAETKNLLSFLARAVDLDAALIPGVMGPWELREGTPQAIIDAQAQLYEWSGWAIEGDDWIEDGATCGEAFIKIVPNEERRTINMDRLKPELAMYIPQHVVDGQTVDLLLVMDRAAIDSEGKTYEYGEAITPMQVRTYKDGQPFGYNGFPDRYDNPLGFVPVVEVKNTDDSKPTFAKALPQVDSVNEMASYLGNIIGRHAEPQWNVSGAEQTDLVKSGGNVWFTPAGSEVSPLVADINIEGVLKFIQELKTEAKSNLPELAFDDLRMKAQIATETLEVQLVELDTKIWRMRRRYDSALITAHHMAALAGAAVGIPDLAVLLAPHSMDDKRPVRPISELEQIQLEQARMGLEVSRQMASGERMTQIAQGQPTEADEAREPEDATSSDARPQSVSA